MRIPAPHDREGLELKMTPMIDVVFLLLVFFLWTSSFEQPEYPLPSAIADLPRGTASASQTDLKPLEPFDDVIIRLDWVNETLVLHFNGQSVDSLDQLLDKLRQIVALGVFPPTIIDPAPQVPIGQAITVYDTARFAGLDRVLFAVDGG